MAANGGNGGNGGYRAKRLMAEMGEPCCDPGNQLGQPGSGGKSGEPCSRGNRANGDKFARGEPYNGGNGANGRSRAKGGSGKVGEMGTVACHRVNRIPP